MSLAQKVRMAVHIWWLALMVAIETRRKPLPELVSSLAEVGTPRRRYPQDPVRLGQVVAKTLTTPKGPPRCLISALVAFRLHRLEGRPVELVIGLPMTPQDKDAHAWLEMNGRDIGPPPGRHGHVELTRYR